MIKSELEKALDKLGAPYLKTTFGDFVIERHQIDVRLMDLFSGYDSLPNGLIFIPSNLIK